MTPTRSPSASASRRSWVTKSALPPPPHEVAELPLQLGARNGIERAERLVEEKERRIGREGARHADPLALAARELMGPPLCERRRLQADEPQELVDARVDPLALPA